MRIAGVEHLSPTSHDVSVRKRALEIKDYISALLAAKKFTITTREDPQDPYGPYLATLEYYNNEGVPVDLAEHLIKKGRAHRAKDWRFTGGDGKVQQV